MMKTNVFFSLSCVLFGNCSAGLSLCLAIWNFGDSVPFTPKARLLQHRFPPRQSLLGSGLDTNGKNGIAYTDSAGISHIAGQGAAWMTSTNPARTMTPH
jgi:hypothetical protein